MRAGIPMRTAQQALAQAVREGGMSATVRNGDNGRNTDGRFAPGNKLGRGNPHSAITA